MPTLRFTTEVAQRMGDRRHMEDAVFNELQERLRALRPALLTDRSKGFLNLFDEFVREHEFELALHTACDYIRESGSPLINKSTLDQIKRLHALMEIDDGCMEELKPKIAAE